jgi:hypothetical protein
MDEFDDGVFNRRSELLVPKPHYPSTSGQVSFSPQEIHAILEEGRQQIPRSCSTPLAI